MRLCRGCYNLAVKAGNMDRIIRMVKDGKFVCVYGKSECGKESFPDKNSSVDEAMEYINKTLFRKG